jgi:hypothetical protein
MNSTVRQFICMFNEYIAYVYMKHEDSICAVPSQILIAKTLSINGDSARPHVIRKLQIHFRQMKSLLDEDLFGWSVSEIVTR